jgi:hypothetical protein
MFARYTLALLLLASVLAGCGSGQSDRGDLPPMPPTMTPDPVPDLSQPSQPPEAVLEGEALAGLTEGEEVVPADQRYALVIPALWVAGSAPSADIAYRESGGLTEDHEYAYNVMREQLPAGISTARAYAESGRENVETTFSDVETVSFEPVQFNDIQGFRWVYTLTVTVDTVFVHQIYVVDAGTGFLLTGSAPADGDLDAAHELFDSISGSFSFPRG